MGPAETSMVRMRRLKNDEKTAKNDEKTAKSDDRTAKSDR
jgi:hypothetical protein